MKRLLAGMALVSAGFATPALAGENFSASEMWGTDGSGAAVNGAYESAATHVQNGITAGQVNAAKEGLLQTTGSEGSITIQSIGSQTVISNSVSGSDNDIHVDAQQTSGNDGDVSNHGQVNTGDSATNNN